MTEEEKQLVTDNHNVIYFVLHRMKLSKEDYYDIAAIGLCNAAMSWDKSGKFYNYAWVCIKYALYKELNLCELPTTKVVGF